MMDRRAFLKGLGGLYGSTSLLAGRLDAFDATSSPLSRFKLGAISDGFSQDFDEALKVMKAYGLFWVEVRGIYGVYNTQASPARMQRVKDSLARYGFRVSVIDSAFYKCALPGTEPVAGSKDRAAYGKQMDLLRRACDSAHAVGADKIRIFTFSRVAEPLKLADRIAEELSTAAAVADSAGIRLVIENEESCNAATGRELAAILAKVPAANLGANWDVGNGYLLGEVSFPDGYNALDKKRISHMHLKGIACGKNLKSCKETFAGEGQIDLVGQLRQLLRDGYQETMSLECEYTASGMSHLETTRRSLEGLLRVMTAAVAEDRSKS
jgi:sugar phosphate isomerase/epimerase